MSPDREPGIPSPGEGWSALTSAVRRFEDAWRQGPRPAIDDYLPAASGLRDRLLVELAHLELELRLKAGEVARVEEYLARYPELAGEPAVPLGLIAAEYELRRRGEPRLARDEYEQRFPQYRQELPATIGRATRIGGDAGWDTASQEVFPEVSGYELLGLLSRGGMGVVYRARQNSLGRLVALKFLPASYAHDPVWLERFRREARTASALNHPHICTIYDTGECDGRPFLSMELIEGKTLESLLGRPVPVAELAPVIGQAARALAAAHAAGVVHRDIKPANVMVRDDGIVKVLDFGLARRVPAAAAAPAGKETDPGTLVGTVLYMSPEQARAEAVTTASDIFSLGIVLYELAAGRHPFQADSGVGVLHAIAMQTPPSPARLNPEVPAGLNALIEQMLAKEPRLRPSAAEVAEALTELAEKRVEPRGEAPPAPGRRLTVGRQAEREILRGGFAAAAAGRGLVLCVTGDAGLGKTALVEDFLDELTAGGRLHSVARGRCSERLAGAEAYLPFLEALDSLLRGDGSDSAAPLMKFLAPTWYVQLAPWAADDPALARTLAEARDAPPERRKRELGVFLDEVSQRRPLVLFLDDVHWADASTVDLLAYLAGRGGTRRLLVVLTYRPADLVLGKHPFGPVQLEWQARGLCREVPLGFLDRADIERYLALKFPGHAFPPELADLVHRRTEGNPLFLVDLLQYLCDTGVLAAEEGRWRLARAVPDFQRELPASVRGLIRRKVDQLSDGDRRLLTAASVQGHEFDAAVVARALDRDAAEVEERLAELDRAHALVHSLREHELPDRTPTVRYAFVHGLYQNALYASLQPTRKAALSAAVARALVDFYGPENPAVTTALAFLFEAARDFPRAADYFRRAAEHAVRVAANQEAVMLARRGLDLLGKLPDTPDRARHELALLLALGVSLVATQGFASPDVEQTYDRARALCQRMEDIPTLFPFLYGLWNVYLVRGELSRCHELAAQMHALAQGQADPVFPLVAHNVRQQPLFHAGDFAAARHHQEQGLALYDRQRHRGLTAVYGEDPGVGCLVYGAVTLWHLGYPDRALRSLQDGRSLADELSNPFNLAQALYYGAVTHLGRREPARVGELADALIALCHEHGFALLLAGGMVLHGWSLTQQGEIEEGVSRMRQGAADWQATGAVSHRPFQLVLLAEALEKQGRFGEGLTALAEAQHLASVTGERFCEAELHRLRGELLGQQAAGASGSPDPAEVENGFRQALNVARRQGARSLALRAAVSLSRWHQRQGRLAEARPTLAEIYDGFTEGVTTPDLQEAKALLETQA